jgi:methionine synthase / methylenetetrahydrofolate reductase(NADPH)
VLNAEFMANEVPGVTVPERVLERMRRTEGAAAAQAEGIAIATEVASGLRGLVQGVHLATPGGGVDAAMAVLQAIV